MRLPRPRVGGSNHASLLARLTRRIQTLTPCRRCIRNSRQGPYLRHPSRCPCYRHAGFFSSRVRIPSTGNLRLDRIEHHLHSVPHLVGFAPQHASELAAHAHRICPCDTPRAIEDVCDISRNGLGDGEAASSAGPTPGEGYGEGAIEPTQDATSDGAESGDSAATEPSASPGWADTTSSGMLDVFA